MWWNSAQQQKETTATCCMDKSQIHSAKWKKLDSKGYISHYSTYMKSGKGKITETEQIRGCYGLGVGEWVDFKEAAWGNILGWRKC